MQHTNQLINASSPYLLQHAHNPVDWFFWGDEALQKAKTENKPILVSIGYSSCHWCHVMERESFEDESIAQIMNEHFINIKIDREERPDLDHIYMDAVQAMTGSGGWPLNVFLTPDLKPFFGGTYFPPKNAHGRLSWRETLLLIYKAFTERKDEIEAQAEQLTTYLKNASSLSKLKNEGDVVIDESNLNTIAAELLNKADKLWGGFGGAPKFPQTFSILFLLRHYHYTKDEKALHHALLSLDKMILGGIYDHVAGGFARYSTDEKWFAPHFEKMLYDNALIVATLAEAYQITKKEIYSETIHQTLQFIQREMMSNEFAFYSALDADSEGVEGKFYTWTKKEIEQILQEDAELFCAIFNITDHGNWEETNIIYLKSFLHEIAAEKQTSYDELYNKINDCKEKLLAARKNRIRPLLDDKVLCSWNALMNIACTKAFKATGNEKYRELAIKNMDFMLSIMLTNESLFHCYKNNKPYQEAYVEDYTNLIWALIQLQEITGNSNYLLKAKELSEIVIQNFSDHQSNYFFFTAAHQKNILVRKVDVYDGATPSANAIFALSLQYLSVVFDEQKYLALSEKMLKGLHHAIQKYPTSFGAWSIVMQSYIHQNKQVVITGEQALTEIQLFHQHYFPNIIVLITNQTSATNIPLLKDKGNNSNLQYYLCEHKTCKAPVNNFEKYLHLYNT